MNENYKDFSLIVDGKNAFLEILKCLEEAEKTVKINMFIWRDDKIGNKMANAVLDCANRGVKVEISVDRYGAILEYAEEGKKSFFHKELTFLEKLKVLFLKLFYPQNATRGKVKAEKSELYYKILNHPNISVSCDVFKADHSKFYVIDDKILFMGGVNIEDKENGCDILGREYGDYMAKIVGEKYVSDFYEKLNSGKDVDENYFFGINRKKINLFEMEELYLDIIKNSEKFLHITMPYFSPIKKFVNEIINASLRGVKVTIIVPEYSNFQNDTNRKTIKKLLKKTDNKINVYFSKKMLHTKLIFNEKNISFGSTNITKKTFKQLDELNLFLENIPSEFKETLLCSVENDKKNSEKIDNYKNVKYRHALAFIEGFLV